VSLRIGMVAGEPSGDRLGAGLLRALQHDGAVEAIGVGGSELTKAGLESIAPMSALTMHGITEPLMRLPSVWRLLREVERRVIDAQVDAFIGIDFNVFNLILERRLKRRGIKTVHYVSPSVYAWRRGRVTRLAKSADLLLTLFPFEPALYAGQPLRAVFVGHPLADEIDPLVGDTARRTQARAELGVGDDELVICVMPGSRRSEIGYMLQPFLAAAREFRRHQPTATFVVPCATEALRMQIAERVAQGDSTDLPVRVVGDSARQVLAASDAALVKSGTSTLEAMLLGVPMVVGYRLGAVSYQLIKRLIRTPFIALPNILAGRALVPELLQGDMQPVLLATELGRQLGDAPKAQLRREFALLHEQLRCDASAQSANEVRALVQQVQGEQS